MDDKKISAIKQLDKIEAELSKLECLNDLLSSRFEISSLRYSCDSIEKLKVGFLNLAQLFSDDKEITNDTRKIEVNNDYH